jgi:PST family polysaccharide transporter
MIRFGVFLTGFNFVNYFARNADNVLIGWWWGASPLGLYSRAYALLTLPIRQINGPISAAAIPALSRLQDDPARYARFYVRGVSLSTLLAMPGVAFMFVAADDLVALILGAQWAGTVPIFRVLAVAALMQVVSNSQGWLYVSGGRTKAMFAWGLVSAPLFVLGFALGLPWGPVGVAWSMVITQGVLFVPGLWLATRAMSAGPLQVLAGVGPNLVSALAGGAVSWVVMPMLRTGIPVVDAATAFAIVAVVYAIGVFGVFRRWAFVRSVLGELRGRREQEAIPDQAMG